MSGLSPGGRMVFVVGNSRSGTTMMGRILGRHPAVFTFGEIHFFEQLWSSADRTRRLSPEEAARLAARLLSIQRRGYLGRDETDLFHGEAKDLISARCSASPTSDEVFGAFLLHETESNGKRIPCDQTPRNAFYVAEILDLYPEARVVNMVRDPRDVLLSQKRKWRRRFLGARGIPFREALRSWVNYHPVIIGKLWNSSIRAVSRFDGDDRVHTLRFEDLLEDPEGEVRRACDLAGIDFREDLLEVPQIGSSSGQDHPERRGINPERGGSWRTGGLSPTEVYLCQKVTATPAKRHGYVPEPVRPNPLRLAWSLASLPLKLAFALLLNLGRMRNIRETIRKRLS